MRTCVADRCAEQRPNGMVTPGIRLHAAMWAAGCRLPVGKRNECAASPTRRLPQRRQRRRRPAAAHGAFGGDLAAPLPAVALEPLTRASRAAAQAGKPQVPTCSPAQRLEWGVPPALVGAKDAGLQLVAIKGETSTQKKKKK